VAERRSTARAQEKIEPEQAASPTPQSPYPAEDPPDEVQTRGAANQSGQLPHNASAGCAKACAWFEQIIETANESGDSAVVTLAQSALDDVGRFVPDALRQPARDAVAR
jgi:hypothetical protein